MTILCNGLLGGGSIVPYNGGNNMNRISPNCSFCGRTESEAGNLLPGILGAFICERCIEESSLLPISKDALASCGFCGGTQKDAPKLFSGMKAIICSVCIEGMLHPSVAIRSGFIIDPQTHIGNWLLNSRNRFVRKYVLGDSV